jgi:hypothetical protein
MSVSKAISGTAILAVAVVAGIVSYTHIYELSIALHQSRLIARLMPFGVDGLITVGSVVMLNSDPAERWHGWFGVGPGVAISLFANAESGIRYGWLSATWARIPAVSFFLACFILENWLKAQAKGAPEVRPGTVPEITPSTSKPVPKRASKRAPADLYAADLAAGHVPSQRRIRADLRVRQDKAKSVQAELSALLAERVPVAA